MRKNGRKYTNELMDEQNEFILAHYNIDMTGQEIADHLKMERYTVISRARMLGLHKGKGSNQKDPTPLNPTRKFGITLPKLSFLEDK